LPIDQKVAKATHVIRTDKSFENTDQQVADVIRKLSGK
jgi:dephospho-CoA kinase